FSTAGGRIARRVSTSSRTPFRSRTARRSTTSGRKTTDDLVAHASLWLVVGDIEQLRASNSPRLTASLPTGFRPPTPRTFRWSTASSSPFVARASHCSAKLCSGPLLSEYTEFIANPKRPPSPPPKPPPCLF